jgi:hypothetical protein
VNRKCVAQKSLEVASKCEYGAFSNPAHNYRILHLGHAFFISKILVALSNLGIEDDVIQIG